MKNWWLGFLGFLSALGIVGIYNKDWWQAIWLVWIFWFRYFLIRKLEFEKIADITNGVDEKRTEKRKREGIVTHRNF